MNVSYRWLRALAPDLRDTPEEVAERLAGLGYPVEGSVQLSEALGDMVVARVRAVHPHPDADRLVVCEVDDGAGGVQVVCGAPNVQPGGWYPLAPVGATLPGGMRIGKAKLRGQLSHGMLCSERELGLGRDESGLMELTGDFTAGAPLVDALGLNDVRMDVEITSNRPDLLSHRGIAREVAPDGEDGLLLPPVPGSPGTDTLAAVPMVTSGFEVSSPPDEGGVTIRIEAPDRCPAYLGLVVSGVSVGPSPHWLQTRLRAAGARPINNVVDATNYVLLEMGHPLHAFDLERVVDRTVVVRRAAPGEPIRTLDGEDRKLNEEMLAICDGERPIAVAGVIGGEDSEVRADTTEILLECALFKPGPIRATRKALGLSTDASYRFERGVDPEGLQEAILRAAELILATGGGHIRGPLLEVRPQPFARTEVELRPARIEQILGVPFEPARIREILVPLGFRTGEEENGSIRVEIPGFRSWDVTREVDLVEEIARRHGYDEFPETLGAFRPGTVPEDPLFDLEDRLRTELVARGLFEAHTLAFAPKGEGEVEIANPVSTEERFLRTSLVPGLLRRLEYNLARGNRDVRLFEIGTVFREGPKGELPREGTHLALVLHGLRSPRHWGDDGAALDLWDLRGCAEVVAATAGGAAWEVRPVLNLPDEGAPEPASPTTPRLAESRDGGYLVVDREGLVRGRAGPAEDDEVELPPWASPVWVLEVELPATGLPAAETVFSPMPAHPSVERDLALLVDRNCPVGNVLALIESEAGAQLEGVEVFDLYEGKGIPDGKISVAIRVRYRAADRTLKDEEVDRAVAHLVRKLEEEMGVGIRGS
ncbi:MAG: phenylalanine--tRNA ligase subunit beta [Gemmatimonadota bacterium]